MCPRLGLEPMGAKAALSGETWGSGGLIPSFATTEANQRNGHLRRAFKSDGAKDLLSEELLWYTAFTIP